ncbi:hypothetical protein B0T16DRAFT_127307 [Cercophora newfieldiana]|uniref:Uncharacterized protein n=1 Tax=Cercophora newfieldiana TaxID=92897 RepID=A0AA39YD24_9PEZI|nr:hypothetical protein B0T16DRAFT_127307 [Cercophora newfieldiana]
MRQPALLVNLWLSWPRMRGRHVRHHLFEPALSGRANPLGAHHGRREGCPIKTHTAQLRNPALLAPSVRLPRPTQIALDLRYRLSRFGQPSMPDGRQLPLRLLQRPP